MRLGISPYVDAYAHSSTTHDDLESRHTGRARRCIAALAIVTASGLVFAAPTLAADDLVPVPEVPAIPEVDAGESVVPGADSAMPAVAPPPEITTPEPPITISVEADGGNVDVSVRVLSPVEDETEPEKGPETRRSIRFTDEPDITPDAPSPQPSSARRRRHSRRQARTSTSR